MFDKIRKRTEFYQILVVAIVLAAVFAFIGVYTYDRMVTDVDSKIEALERSRSFYMDVNPSRGSVGSNGSDVDMDVLRNSLIIKMASDGSYVLSNYDFFTEEMLVKMLDSVKKGGKGKINIDGSYLAYSTVENTVSSYDYTIYVYDYSKEYNAFVYNLITILITGITVMAVVSFFIMRFTKRNFLPIENAFVKQQELVANASHELKTPLTIINTNLSILNSSADEMTDEQQKWLNGITTQVNRMSAMINEMLELARIESTKEKNDLTKINMSEIVESVVLETEALAFERDIKFESSITANINIMARKKEIEKLVYILVENAMKYTDVKGVISVKLTSEKHKATLRVRNTGDGIPREQLPKLFDRFYRCEESHTTSGSFGLGLSIAKAIAEGNGGGIGVDSKIGQYTEFVSVFKEV